MAFELDIAVKTDGLGLWLMISKRSRFAFRLYLSRFCLSLNTPLSIRFPRLLEAASYIQPKILLRCAGRTSFNNLSEHCIYIYLHIWRCFEKPGIISDKNFLSVTNWLHLCRLGRVGRMANYLLWRQLLYWLSQKGRGFFNSSHTASV